MMCANAEKLATSLRELPQAQDELAPGKLKLSPAVSEFDH